MMEKIEKIITTQLIFIFVFLGGIAMCCAQTHDQVPSATEINTAKRSFTFRGVKINFLAATNRMGGDFTFPGMKACIIVGEPEQTTEEIYKADRLRKIPYSGIADYACFYYLPYSVFLKNATIQNFLKQFIDHNFEKDSYDRNKVFLIWENKTNPISTAVVDSLHTIIAAVGVAPSTTTVLNNSPIFTYDESNISFLRGNYKATTTYNILDIPDVAEKESQARSIALENLKNTFFFKFTGGINNIGNPNKTTYDNLTLVDFSTVHTIWNFQLGYYFTNWLAPFANIGFTYTGLNKSLNSIDVQNDNITIDASGSGGAMIRTGVGMRIVPYKHKRLNTYIDLIGGYVKVIAVGGTGTILVGDADTGTTKLLNDTKENSHFYGVSTGINYRISRLFYFTGCMEYDISPLDHPIGSVTSFTGLSINAGIGVTISHRKKAD